MATAAAARLLLQSSSSSSTAAAAAAGAFAVAVTGGAGYFALDDSSNEHHRRLSINDRHQQRGATTTTRCEAPTATTTTTTKQQLPLGVNLRSRMTAIGHFSILSETVHNPSICTFVMTLSNNKDSIAGGDMNAAGDAAAFSARDFISLWKERNMAKLHPRFHLRASATHPGHFESTSTSSSSSSSAASSSLSNDDMDEDRVELHVSEGLPLQNAPRRRADILQRVRQMQTQPWSLHEKLWHVDVIPPALPALWFSLGSAAASNEDKDKESTSTTTTILFRGHHVLADGASMGAALMDLSDEGLEFRTQIVAFVQSRRRQQAKRLATFWQRLVQRFKIWIWLCRGSMQALLYQTKLVWYNALWNRADPWSMVKKAAQREQKSRKKARDNTLFSINGILDPTNTENEPIATVAADLRSVSYATMAPLAQAKWIAETLSKEFNHDDNNNSSNNKRKQEPKITINDLFVTAITAAIMRQLKEHRQRLNVISSYQQQQQGDNNKKKTTKSSSCVTTIPRQDRIHVSVPVHIKGGVVLPGESVGNNIGAFTVQLPGEESTAPTASEASTASPAAVQRLFAVHQELLKVKQTPAPVLSNMIARMSVAILPRAWVSYLFQKANAGSTCVITNVRGPSSQHMHMKGHTVESLYGFVPLPPGIPIGVVVSSYAGQMLLTVTAESWAVPNADLFLTWVVDEYLVLLKEASRAAAKEQRLQSIRLPE